jgi:glycosyltransferase involved in cell wall biosynthesis
MGILRKEISKADYLHFAIGGLWGDWAALASLVAIRAGLPFAVWTDRVQSKACEFESRTKTGFRRANGLFKAKVMAHYERYIIRRCSLGLFHGMDCFETYAPDCKNPHLVHDIHVGADNLITPSGLSDRLSHLASRPLRFAYAGRLHQEKGIFDWIEALSVVAKAGIDFEARWFSPGGGPELVSARNLVQTLGLTSRIEFPGTIDSHAHLLAELRTFDAFVFCHKISESPRCLIEALQCGLPIIGYETSYSKDLIRVHGGGLLTPINRVADLAQCVISLSKDLPMLRALSERAAQDGTLFTDEAVFRHRSELMKFIKVHRPSCAHSGPI